MLTVFRFFFLCSAAQHYFSYLAFDYSISAIIRAPFACHNKQRSSNTLKTVSAYFPNMISQFSTSFEKDIYDAVAVAVDVAYAVAIAKINA